MYPSDHRGVVGVFKIDRTARPYEAKAAEAVWRLNPDADREASRRRSAASVMLERVELSSTGLQPYQGHALASLFDLDADTYFWSDRPARKGDAITLRLRAGATRCKAPAAFVRVEIQTGLPPDPALAPDAGVRDGLERGVARVSYRAVAAAAVVEPSELQPVPADGSAAELGEDGAGLQAADAQVRVGPCGACARPCTCCVAAGYVRPRIGGWHTRPGIRAADGRADDGGLHRRSRVQPHHRSV